MNLESLGNLGEFIASIATLITLIYLALQIKQNTAATKISASQSIMSSLNNALQVASSSPDTARATVLGQTDFSKLSDDEKAQFMVWMFSWFRTLEQAHFYYTRGYLDEEIWLSQVRHLNQAVKAEGVLLWWESRRALFSESFQRLIETAMASEQPVLHPRDVIKKLST